MADLSRCQGEEKKKHHAGKSDVVMPLATTSTGNLHAIVHKRRLPGVQLCRDRERVPYSSQLSSHASSPYLLEEAGECRRDAGKLESELDWMTDGPFV